MTAKAQQFVLRADQTRPHVQTCLVAFLGRLPGDKAWEVSIGPHHDSRTKKQNRTLWRAYKVIGDTLGYDREDLEALHEDLLCQFFGYTERWIMQRMRTVPNQRSSKLKTAEFCQFYDFVVRKAAEFGVVVSDPDPLHGVEP